ncbi:TPA: hypothetical protein ACXEYS_005176, partial [Escherichia coli]
PAFHRQPLEVHGYDADLDFQRPMDEQTATRFLAELKKHGSANFDIKFHGEAPIELSGIGYPF